MSTYDGGFKAILTNSINTLNALSPPLRTTGYTMGSITAIEAESPTSVNTSAILTGDGIPRGGEAGYAGTASIEYRRLDLTVMFRGIDVNWTVEADTSASFATWLAETYGIPLSEDDLITVDLPHHREVYIEIHANPTSPWVFGYITVYLNETRPDIGWWIDETWASGVYSALPPVDANYKVSYPYDYSKYSTFLINAENPKTDAAREMYWHMLFGSRASQWDSETTGILYQGSTAIQAVGGRSGFDYLLVVPRLNAWAHFNLGTL